MATLRCFVTPKLLVSVFVLLVLCKGYNTTPSLPPPSTISIINSTQIENLNTANNNNNNNNNNKMNTNAKPLNSLHCNTTSPINNNTDINSTDATTLGSLQPRRASTAQKRTNIAWNVALILVKIILFVVGVTGNVIVVLTIITTPSMHTLQNYYVFNLAITDLFILVVNLPWSIYTILVPTWPFGHFTCKWLLPICDIVPPVSILTLVAISVDRYRAITSTLSRSLSVKSTVILLVSLWLVCYLVVGLPVSFVMKYNPSMQRCGAMFMSDNLRKAYYTIRFALLYVLPSIVIFFCYVRVNKTLGNSMRFLQRSVTGKSQVVRLKRQKHVMSMFFAIFVTFAICFLPFNVIVIVYNYATIHKKYRKVLGYCTKLASVIGIGNSVCNPIILYSLSKAFRKNFRKYLKCLFPKRHSASGDLEETPVKRLTTSVALCTPEHENRRQNHGSNLSLILKSPTRATTKISFQKNNHFEKDEELLDSEFE